MISVLRLAGVESRVNSEGFMETNVSQKVIEKIKKEHLSPKASWYFALVRTLVLTALAVFILAGALSFGIIFELIRQFEIARLLGIPRGLNIVLMSLPYLWIIFVVFFLVLALADFARTRHGYKYRLFHIFIALFLVMVFLGAFFHVFGFCDQIEAYLERQLPFYSRIVVTPQGVWSRPDDGLLSGMIIGNDSVLDQLELRDWRADTWDVDYTKATIIPPVKNVPGEMIKVIGQKEPNHNFRAVEIRPWNGRRMPFKDLDGLVPPVRPDGDR